jgi:hypothetical protein
MNEGGKEVEGEISALYALLDKEERSKSEQYKVGNFEKELDCSCYCSCYWI